MVISLQTFIIGEKLSNLYVSLFRLASDPLNIMKIKSGVHERGDYGFGGADKRRRDDQFHRGPPNSLRGGGQ